MEHIKWLFDGIGVVIVLALIRFSTKFWKEKTEKKNLILVAVFGVLLIGILLLQFFLFKDYWVKFIPINRLQIGLVIFISTVISGILSFIYQSHYFSEIKKEYISIRLELEKNNIELKDELQLVKASDNFIDDITGLPSYKALPHTLLERINRSIDNNSSLSLILVDIDGFKKMNSIYLVQGADLILKEVGEFLQRLIRKEDRILRFRIGDEILIIAYDTDVNGANGFKNRIKREIIKEDFTVGENKIKVSVAVGIIEYDLAKDFSKYKTQTDELWRLLEEDKLKEENDLA